MLLEVITGNCKFPVTVLTIHESQGLKSKKFLLVQINTKSIDLFNSIPHIIVVLSRHTQYFRYITSAGSDMMSDILNSVDNLNESDLQKWNSDRILEIKRENIFSQNKCV